MNAERQEVHSLVDQLAISQLAAVHSLLEGMLDPVARAIAGAEVDDEPETAEERQAVAEATEWLKHNEPIRFEDILADFGLTPRDLKRRGRERFPGTEVKRAARRKSACRSRPEPIDVNSIFRQPCESSPRSSGSPKQAPGT
jgi:hypothetical protein